MKLTRQMVMLHSLAVGSFPVHDGYCFAGTDPMQSLTCVPLRITPCAASNCKVRIGQHCRHGSATRPACGRKGTCAHYSIHPTSGIVFSAEFSKIAPPPAATSWLPTPCVSPADRLPRKMPVLFAPPECPQPLTPCIKITCAPHCTLHLTSNVCPFHSLIDAQTENERTSSA